MGPPIEHPEEDPAVALPPGDDKHQPRQHQEPAGPTGYVIPIVQPVAGQPVLGSPVAVGPYPYQGPQAPYPQYPYYSQGPPPQGNEDGQSHNQNGHHQRPPYNHITSQADAAAERPGIIAGTITLFLGFCFPVAWIVGMFLPLCHPRSGRIRSVAIANGILFIIFVALVVILPAVLVTRNNNSGDGGGNFGNQVTHPVAGRRFLAVGYGQGT